MIHHVYNNEYPAQVAALKKQIDDHAPVEVFCKDNGTVIWNPEYATEEDERKCKDAREKLHQLEQRMEAELNARLHRIIGVRGPMWT